MVNHLEKITIGRTVDKSKATKSTGLVVPAFHEDSYMYKKKEDLEEFKKPKNYEIKLFGYKLFSFKI